MKKHNQQNKYKITPKHDNADLNNLTDQPQSNLTQLISITTPCFNEEGNIEPLYHRIKAALATLPQYRYEHIFIDNASTDNTVERIKSLASKDKNVKLIANCRNFGPIRSPLHVFLESKGNAVIVMASDLQDPPELIPEFIKKWEEGYKVVIGTKPQSKEPPLIFLLRKIYYKSIGRISDVPLIENFTGFGLYDRVVVEDIRETNDRYPYFRGLVADLGYPRAEIPFIQPKRAHGVPKINLYGLYDVAMLGVTSHSKVPLRLATMAGFFLSFISLLIAFGYLTAKLLFWESFSLGMAPLVTGVFFFASVQLFFIGILGEYIGAIHTQVTKRPLVTEKERINFDN